MYTHLQIMQREFEIVQINKSRDCDREILPSSSLKQQWPFTWDL